jgi:hypothetical protein
MAVGNVPASRKTFRLPDGSFFEVPENLTEQDRYRLRLDLANRFPDEYGSLLDPYQTFAGGAAEFLKGVPRGAASSLAGAAQGIVGLATPGIETDVEKDLSAFQSYLETESPLAADEAYRDFLATKLGAGLGSVATYALPGAAAKVLGASATGVAARSAGAALAGAGGAGTQAQRIEEQRRIGEEITTGEELGALALGTGIGFTELLPIERLFRKTTPETGSALLNIFSSIGKRSPLAASTSQEITRLVSGAARQGLAEGLQEGLAGIGQDLASKVTYDEDIEIGGSFLDDLMIGGGVGAIADVIVDAMGGRRTVANKLFEDKERKLRKDRIDRITQIAAERAAERNTEAAAKMPTAQAAPLALPSPGQVTGGTYIPTADTAEGVYNVTLKSNPDRFTQVVVFNAPDPSGTRFTTMAYNPDSNQYYDITEDLASGRNISDTLTIAMAGDLGVISKDVDPKRTALGFSALSNQIGVAKNANIPTISTQSLVTDIDNGRVVPVSEDGFFKINPLPSGEFTIVDMTRGLPVADFSKDEPPILKFADINEAYQELKSLNDTKSALASNNTLTYTGLLRNSSAFRLARILRSPENRMIQKSVLSAFIDKKEDRAGLKTFYSPEETRKIIGPRKFDDMMQQYGQIVDRSNTVQKYVPNATEIDPTKRSISPQKLKELGRDKNLDIDINNNNFKTFAKYWTGTSNWADMSNGQRLYVMSRIAEAEAMPQMIKFPNLFQRQYSKAQFDTVIAEMARAKDGVTPKLGISEIQKVANVNKDAAKQIYDDLIYSGRAKPLPPGKIQLIKSEQDYLNDRRLKATQVDVPLDQKTRDAETAQQAADRMRGMGFSEDSISRVEQAVKQTDELPVKPSNATATAIGEAVGRAEQAVAEGANPQDEKVAVDFSAKMADMLNKLGVAKLVKHSVETGKPKVVGKTKSGADITVLGGFDAINREIMVNIKNQLDNKNLTEQQIVDYINDVVNHEVIHVMREADLITEKEWNTLSNFVRNAAINKSVISEADPAYLKSGGKTLMENIRIRYANSGLNEVQLTEEAVAEAYRLWVKHGNKFVAGKPASLFRRILNYIKSFAGAFKASGATNIDQIFSAIQRGEIGARTPGFSIFNPDANAVVRSTKILDEKQSVKMITEKGGRNRGVQKFTQKDSPAGMFTTSREIAGYTINDANNEVAALTQDRVNWLLDHYGYVVPTTKAKAYIGYVSPEDFISATTPAYYRKTIEEESRPLDKQELVKTYLPIFLQFRNTPFNEDGTPSSTRWSIRGHEGRHRMQALMKAGVKKVPVVFELSGDESDDPRTGRSKPKNAKKIDAGSITALGQVWGEFASQRAKNFVIEDELIPISYAAAEDIKNKFINPDAFVSFMASEAKPNKISRRIVESRAGSDFVKVLYSQDPISSILDEFDDLNSVTAKEIEQAKNYIKNISQRALRNRFGDEITIYRGIKGTEENFPILSYTLDKGIAKFNAEQQGIRTGKIEEIKVPVSDVLSYSTAIDGARGRFDEEEVIIFNPRLKKEGARMSDADIKRVNDFMESHVGNTPKGAIPRFNPNASKQAINAALNFEIDGKEPELPDFARKYMLSSIQEEEIPNSIINKETSRHGKIKAEPVTLTEKAINLLDSWKLGGFSEDFDNFSRVFRKAVVDRYNEFRRQETELIGSENEGLLMAETSASSALGMLDRARGIVAQMLNKGGIRWVTGDEMVTNDPTQFKGDNLAGYYEIDPNVPGLLDSLSKVMDGSVPKGLSVFKTYSTYKRIQGFRQRARDAAIRLANMDQASDPQTAAALKLIIEAEKKARLIDNPSDARISQFIAEVETDYPQVKEAYDNYQKWNTTLIDFGKSTGILTEELAQQWKDWGDYFPFYEEMEESIVGGMGYKKGSSLTRSDFFFKQLENRAKDLDQADPFEMITKNAYGILVSGLKNVAARRILRNSEAVGEARKVPDAKTARALRKRGSFTQSVLVDGLEQHYEIADPLLYESMMNYGESALGMITKIASAPAGLLREMVTREPGFILLNMLRDTVSTYVTSGVDYIPFIDSFKEFNSEEMQRLIDQGVVGGYDLSADPSDLKRYVADEYRKRGIDVKTHSQTSSNMARQLWDALGGYSQKSDAAVRTAVYKKVLAETGSEATARLAAIDVLNFSRRGANPLWRSITATIPFLNARIQGLDKIYTTLTGKYSPYDGLDPRVLTQKRALLRGGAIAAMTGIYFLLMSDNEEYKKARREVRDDNWIIPTGVEGVTLKLPIPFEIGAIFKTVPEIFLNFTFGDLDARGARDSIVRQINNSTNIDLLGFQAIKPLVDVMRNRDSFTGKEIVPYWVNKSTEVSQQYDDRTTEISKYIGNLFNISPMKLDYLIGGYGGSLGTSLLLTANAAWEQASGDKTAGSRADWTDINNVPVIRRFLMDTRLGGVGTRVQQDYYELRDEVRKAVATLNKFKEENDVDGYYAYQNSKLGLLNVRQEVLAIDKYLKRYRDTRDALRKSDLPPDTIRKLLREIEDEKNLRLTVVPTLREQADIPANIGSAIFDAFIG